MRIAVMGSGGIGGYFGGLLAAAGWSAREERRGGFSRAAQGDR